MDNYTIDIEKTDSPLIVKFTADSMLSEQGGSYEFANIDEAAVSPLSQQLFYLPFVKRVFITANFIAVERYEIVEWEEVQEAVRLQIEEYLNKGGSVFREGFHQKKKTPVSVYAEMTPNPSVMKFVANKPLVKNMLAFKSADSVQKSPLAVTLFHFPFVKEVFISDNYVAITKHNDTDWEAVTLELREFLTTYLRDEKPIVEEGVDHKVKNTYLESYEATEEEKEISGHIDAILQDYIRPAVAADGGNISLHSYHADSKTLKVILQGACDGCPSSTITLKNGIEATLREMLPGKVDKVIALNG